jgi:hypothetical protein
MLLEGVLVPAEGLEHNAQVFESPTARRLGVGLTTQKLPCAVRRHGLPVGANPTRQLSLRPVAIGAVVEVTKRLKPSM